MKKLKNKHKLVLFLIIIYSAIAKLCLTEWNESVSSDALTYYYYAVELFFHNKLPTESYPLHNLGFPVFLALVFKIFPREAFDQIFFSNIQRTVTIIISCAAIPLIYLLCNKFFQVKYSLIGAFMFAFEPRIIQNSTFGITDPLFLLVSVGAWVLFYSRKKYMVFAFVLAGLAATVRFEGIILFPIFLILLYLKRKKFTKIRINMFVFSALFASPIIGFMIFSMQNGIKSIFLSKIYKEIVTVSAFINNGIVMGGQTKEFPEMVLNSFLYYGWSTFPMFIFFLPIGLYAVYRQNKEVILGMILVSISGIVAYFDAYDTRYFFPAYPFFILISLYGIRELKKHFSKKDNK